MEDSMSLRYRNQVERVKMKTFQQTSTDRFQHEFQMICDNFVQEQKKLDREREVFRMAYHRRKEKEDELY
jgi:hypothetical protein